MTITTEQFISVLVDCKGYSIEEALEIAIEYRNNIASYIYDIGGNEENIAQVKRFLL